MIVHKYDPRAEELAETEIPDDWEACTYSADMGKVIGCAQCGRKIAYGSGYTSLEVFDGIGFGYIVCPACYEKEWNRRKAAINHKEAKK